MNETDLQRYLTLLGITVEVIHLVPGHSQYTLRYGDIATGLMATSPDLDGAIIYLLEYLLKKHGKMEHWSTVLDIVESGMSNDKEKVKAYAELLLSKLDKQSQEYKRLKDVLEDKPIGKIIHLA